MRILVTFELLTYIAHKIPLIKEIVMNRLYWILFLSFLSIPLISSAADLEKGKAIFLQVCSSCHGNEGQGDGPIAAGLPDEMKPRNLVNGELKVAKDAQTMKELVKKGGPAFGLNPLMAPQAGLSDEDLENVVAFVQSLRK